MAKNWANQESRIKNWESRRKKKESGSNSSSQTQSCATLKFDSSLSLHFSFLLHRGEEKKSWDFCRLLILSSFSFALSLSLSLFSLVCRKELARHGENSKEGRAQQQQQWQYGKMPARFPRSVLDNKCRKDAEKEKELLKLLREKMCVCGCVLNARQLWKVRTTVLPSESLSLICICPLSFRKDEKKKAGDGCGGGGGRRRRIIITLILCL